MAALIVTGVAAVIGILLVVLVLLQKPKEKGLGTALGGMSGGNEGFLKSHARSKEEKLVRYTTVLLVLLFLCVIAVHILF